MDQRYHGLDLLRSVAMLLGLVIHAPLVYNYPRLAREFQFFVPAAILLLWPLTLGAREYGFWAFIPEQLDDFDLIPFLYYLSWFLLGALIYCSRDVLKRLESNRVLIVMAVFAIGSYVVLFVWGRQIYDPAIGYLRSTPPANFFLLIGAVSTITTVTWSLLAIGLAHRLFKAAHPLVNWLVELSYSIYLLHIFFTIMIGGLLLHTGWVPIAAIGVNILLTFVICVACYYIFIKFTPLNWIINGYRKSWLKLPRRPGGKAAAS